MKLTRTALVFVTLAALSPAQGARQDLIAVDFAGNAYTLDSRTGAGSLLAPTGLARHNSMARVGRQLYTNEQAGTGTSPRFLATFDDRTGQAIRSVPIARDLRGLAPGVNFTLMAIADNGLNDQFVSVDVFNGPITVIGLTGFSGLQGLTLHANTFYAWDVNLGLVRINHLTGAGTDVNPSVGTNGAIIQFLTTTSDGRVLGGKDSLYQIDVTTGVPTLIGSGNYTDLRGAEERSAVIYNFGQRCANVILNVSGSPKANTTVVTTSTGNLGGAPGFLILGFSDHTFSGLPLPLPLDSLLGTVGCSLLTSPDFTLGATTSTLGILSLPVPIPPFAQGVVFHVQHMSVSNAPGGLAFSNATTVRVQL